MCFLDEFKYGSTVIKWLKINFLIELLHLAPTASPTLLETPTALSSIISLEFGRVKFLFLLHDDLLCAC